jgi:hypothetical protein
LLLTLLSIFDDYYIRGNITTTQWYDSRLAPQKKKLTQIWPAAKPKQNIQQNQNKDNQTPSLLSTNE